MKLRSVILTLSCLALAGLLEGCPIYGDGQVSGCVADSECARGSSCDVRTGTCVGAAASAPCERPGDCRENETCSRNGRCVSGDCSFSSVGCVAGYRCEKQREVWECVSERRGAGGSTGSAIRGTQAGAAGDAGSAI